MSEYTLSVVQLCPAIAKDAANTIAEASGYGPNNLGVELRHTDGSTWYGCHAWWIPEVLAAKSSPTGDPAIDDVLAHVITSVRDGGDPLAHWHEALEANGLSVVEAPE